MKPKENENITLVENYEKFEVSKSSLINTLIVTIQGQERQFTEVNNTSLAD
jgi:hypothetical protein